MCFSNRLPLAIAITFMSASPLLARTSSSSTTLIVPPDGLLIAEVAGKPANLVMVADSGSAPILNATEAKRLGIGTGWIGLSVVVKVGPVPVKGSTGVFSYRVGGMGVKRRGAWFERDIVQGQSGMIGPGAVAQPVVTFRLRAALPGERTFFLPLTDKGVAGMGTLIGNLFVQFDPLRSLSMATAAAGADLAREYQGHFVGDGRREAMRFGIARPVRNMVLVQPMRIGELALSTVAVRFLDYGNSGSIPDATHDPDEIVVTGRKGTSKSYRTLHLGADALRTCSSLTFDKARKVISLSCSLRGSR